MNAEAKSERACGCGVRMYCSRLKYIACAGRCGIVEMYLVHVIDAFQSVLADFVVPFIVKIDPEV